MKKLLIRTHGQIMRLQTNIEENYGDGKVRRKV